MSKLTFTSPRATYAETLAFANAVREAGGGNPLDALMPAVPEDSEHCLIAVNLNFNCYIDSRSVTINGETKDCWVMETDTTAARKIATALELPLVSCDDEDEEWIDANYGNSLIVLPPEIGQVAEDFDRWNHAMEEEYDRATGEYRYSIKENATDEEKERLAAFWPYIEASVRESYENATFVKDGKLVL